jgi:hypothetical protein
MLMVEHLSGQIEKASVDKNARTVEMMWYSGADVPRYDAWRDEEYWLRFSMEPSAVKLERLRAGASLMDSHNRFELAGVIGVVNNPRIENGKGYATAKFSERDEVTPIWEDVLAGIIRSVSMGVQVYDLADETPKNDKIKHFVATRWEPEEISVVAVGADPSARFVLGAFSTRAEFLGFQRRRPKIFDVVNNGVATRTPDYFRLSIQLRRARLRALSV